MNVITCPKGKKIFVEGAEGSTMFEVLEGSVGIYTGYGSGEQRLLTEVKPGSLFGEMALLEGLDRSATAVALEEGTELLEVSSGELLDFFRGQGERVLELMYSLSRRTRELTADFAQVCATLGEMRRTRQDSASRPEGLWDMIRRFIGLSSRQREEQKPVPPLPDPEGPEKRAWPTQTYSEGVVIFLEGDRAERLYELLEGSVSIRLNCGKPNEKELTVLRPGAFFGEMGLLDHEPRSASAVAAENGTVVESYTADDFTALLAERSEKVIAIVRHMSSRLRGLTEDYLKACRTVAELSAAEEDGSAPAPETDARAADYAARETDPAAF